MPQPNDLSRSLAALDQDSTLIAVVELSQSSGLVAGIVPPIKRQPLKKLAADEMALLQLLHRWRDEATKAGCTINRIAVAYEAGRDGFWPARWLQRQGVEAHVIHLTSDRFHAASYLVCPVSTRRNCGEPGYKSISVELAAARCKSAFQRTVKRAREHGPQHVSVRGELAVVVVSVEEFARLTTPRPSIVDHILAGARWPDDVVDTINTRSRDPGRDVAL
jgi:prevent-host-death family protein